MRKYQIEEEIFQLKIIFSYYPSFRTFDHRYKLLRGRFTCTKMERCASPSHLPLYPLPANSHSFKYFSYKPPSSSAYNKAHGPWHNHDLILQATPKNGGCGSAAFLLAERLHSALLFPISFSHRLQSFSYYFHNRNKIKRFFPLNLFQKCFPANYTCCVCRKTFCEQLQFGIVCKPSIIESRLDCFI